MPSMSLDLVVSGWELPGLERDFYPADLPLDWRLSFFANEFPAVMAPGALWSRADYISLRTWFEDVPEGFRFYFQDPGGDVGSEQRDLARSALGTKLAGLVSDAETRVSPAADRFQILSEAGSVTEEGFSPAWKIPSVCVQDLRSGRAWLESLRTPDESVRGLLILAGDDVRAEDLRRWWHLLWLMGAA